VGFEEILDSEISTPNQPNITEMNSYCNRCPSLILNSLALYGTLSSEYAAIFFLTQTFCSQDKNGNYCTIVEVEQFEECVWDSNEDNEVECSDFLCNSQCADNELISTWLGHYVFPPVSPLGLWAEYKPEICYMKGTPNEIIMEIH
jgi:hypothetical protein